MSPEPGCFIVASQPDDADDMPVPYLVSLSFDEVHAYLEGDEQIYSVEIPALLYQWAEAYVLSHYVAIKKTKRKLKNWSQDDRPKPGPRIPDFAVTSFNRLAWQRRRSTNSSRAARTNRR